MSISLVCASGSSHSQSLLSLVRSLVLCKRFGLCPNRSSCPFRAVISHSSNVRLISFEHSHGHEIPSEPPHPTRNLPASRPATRMPLLGKSVHPEAGMWRSVALQAADLTRPGDMDDLVHLRFSAVKVQCFAGVHRRSLEPGLKLSLSANPC